MKIDESKLTPIDMQVLSALEMHRAEVMIGKKLMRLKHRQYGLIVLEPNQLMPGWQLSPRGDAAVNNRVLSWRGGILVGRFHRALLRSGMTEDVEVDTTSAAAAAARQAQARMRGYPGGVPNGGLTGAANPAGCSILSQHKLQKMMSDRYLQGLQQYMFDNINSLHGSPNPFKVDPPSS